MKTDYDKLVIALIDAQIPCTIKLMEDHINVELGIDFCDIDLFKVYDILEECEIGPFKVNICAESHGGNILETTTINPKT